MSEPRSGRDPFEARFRRLAALGPRGATSEAEKAAARHLASELASLGLHPELEPFAGCPSMGARLLVPVLIAAGGAGLLTHSAAVSAVFGAVALIALVAEQMAVRVWLTRPLARRPSANVVATVPAVGPARRRVVLCAHYDTQRAGLIWNPFTTTVVAPLQARLPGPLKTILFPVALAMAVQMVVGGLAAGGVFAPPIWAPAALLGVYAAAGLLLGEWAVRAPVPGAADNASGVAAVLDVVGRWIDRPGDGVEVVVLLSSCEETGMLGAAAWCDRHEADLVRLPTYFLNVDGVGFGPPRFLGCEVPMAGWPVRYPGEAVRMAAKVAAAGGWADAGPHAMPGPTDGLAFLSRGVPGLTVVGFRGPGIMHHYHQPSDTADHTDRDAAWAGAEFAWALLQRLAADERRPYVRPAGYGT